MASKQIKVYKNIGGHRHYTSCRFCFSKNVKSVIHLGDMPLAGGFFKKETRQEELDQENFYPLEIYFCRDCFLLQVNTSVNADILFKDYFYFSSSIKTLVQHFEKNAEALTHMYPDTSKRFIVEIGCNDGGMITALLNKGFRALGVDPASNVVQPLIKKGVPIINTYFTEKAAKEIVQKHGRADAIYSFHALAHIEDMHDVLKGIKTLLKKDGFLAFEVHYLGDLLREVQYDMIYHEHQFYYSLLALKNFFAQYDMEIFDVKHVPIRAGSMQYFVQHKQTGKRKITKSTRDLEAAEKMMGLHKVETYESFSHYIQKTRQQLLNLLVKLKADGKQIAGYGASGRGTIIMNYCNLSTDLMPYIVDDAPAKHGALTPGTHHKILSSEVLDGKKRPDFVILFAWPFLDEIKKRKASFLENGGKFIVPLPKVKIISA